MLGVLRAWFSEVLLSVFPLLGREAFHLLLVRRISVLFMQARHVCHTDHGA
jgi:hypothetical protein